MDTDQLPAELEEQCRINAMGQERELRLLAIIEEQRNLLGHAAYAIFHSTDRELMKSTYCAINNHLRDTK